MIGYQYHSGILTLSNGNLIISAVRWLAGAFASAVILLAIGVFSSFIASISSSGDGIDGLGGSWGSWGEKWVCLKMLCTPKPNG